MSTQFSLTVGKLNPRQTPDGQDYTGDRFCYNDTIPGPVIRVQEGEKVSMLINNQSSQTTSVHWHGIHQLETPHHDGVPIVSHPPIEPGGSHDYQFIASPAGTHWYHSHSGLQYSEGLFGALIVEARDDPYQNDYQSESVLLISDWFHDPSMDLLAAVQAADSDMDAGMGAMDGMSDTPDAASPDMAAGMSMDADEDLSDVAFQAALINGKGGQAAPEQVDISAGENMRLRVINGSGTFDFRFAVDDHRLRVIAVDGNHVEALETDSIIFAPGERYDFIIQADQPAGNYNIRVQTLEKNVTNGVMATLHYRESNQPAAPDESRQWGTPLALSDLRPLNASPVVTPDRTVVLQLAGSMSPYQWMIGIDGASPNPLSIAADPQSGRVVSEAVAARIVFKRGQQVRMIINGTDMSHPFHLHGHSFQVLGLSAAHAGKYNNDPLNLTNPITKDTINIQENGWAVIQWQANNLGDWLFHCHIEWHAAVGMGLLITVE